MDMLKKYKAWDVEFNDINEKLTTKKDEFKKQIDNNEESVYYNFAGIWGISFKDVSKLDLSSFTAQQLSRIPFSTLTKFPTKSKLPNGYDPKKLMEDGLNSLPKMIKNLHKKGIDGHGVTIAVIDRFNTFKHKEFEGVDLKIANRNIEFNGEDFHGLQAVAALCGKNIGIAPGSKVLFYPNILWSEDIDKDWLKISLNDEMDCFEEILKQVKNGTKIDIVSFSGKIEAQTSNIQESSKEAIRYNKIKKELEQHGCTVITSKEFWDAGFTYSYKINNFADINDFDNEVEHLHPNEGRLNILCGGKSYPLIGTKDGYKYEGTVGSASWSIPVLSGIFALAKQVDRDLTFNKFVEYATKTSVKNKYGVNFVNAYNLCKTLKQENERTKTHALQNI